MCIEFCSGDGLVGVFVVEVVGEVFVGYGFVCSWKMFDEGGDVDVGVVDYNEGWKRSRGYGGCFLIGLEVYG